MNWARRDRVILSEETVAAIELELSRGVPQTVCAEIFGVERAHIRRIADALPVKPPKRVGAMGAARSRLEGVRQGVGSWLAKGKTQREVAKHFRVSPYAVQKIAADLKRAA